jgi:hypothetical protein
MPADPDPCGESGKRNCEDRRHQWSEVRRDQRHPSGSIDNSLKDPTRSGPAAHGVSAIVALPAREPVRAVGQRPLQFLPGPYPLAQPAEAEEPARRVQPVHGRCRLPARE